MNVIQALIMGLVQGLTEFLPVSSSAHLVFADHFLRIRLTEADTVSFDVLLHLGTLVAVLIFFRREVWQILRGTGQLVLRPRAAWRENPFSRLAVLLVLGTIPAAVAGVALQDFFQAYFQNVPGTAALLLVTAAMLIWISRRKTGDRSLETVNWKDTLLIGAFQAVAILPGISRSGSTITGGLLRGLDREAAPRFSFLLSIPIILGGGLKDVKDMLETGTAMSHTVMAVGFVAAAVSGYVAVVLLLSIVRKGRLDRFAYYCVVAGVGMLAYWTLLVPKIDTHSLVGLVNNEPKAIFRDGELSAVELGQKVQLQFSVNPGMIPVDNVEALVPVDEQGSKIEMARTGFTREAGSDLYLSEIYPVRPLGAVYQVPAAGATRDILVVLRNRWGIVNEVRLRLRVMPESPERLQA